MLGAKEKTSWLAAIINCDISCQIRALVESVVCAQWLVVEQKVFHDKGNGGLD